ncbi:hypothetical protein B188_07280 [Candidatus Brocadiaceae bacterium B188]|nr:hypothetical protein [Candidatus Brocadia sapporoensis]RZV58017.1 MAG: hypothetical protein EX330_07095 [Candidatus Brocadia sp. BROELEC01]TWU52769.1 hypothetical protein B188_07280 [Candidatus Brocadiaceae bacterium B188]
MTKGSDSREFFEIFKPMQKAEDVQKGEVMSQEESAESRQPSKPPNHDEKLIVKPASTADPLGWIKKTSGEGPFSKEGRKEAQPVFPPLKEERPLRKDEIVVRQETLIIGAIAATFLSIACFFVGHKVGYNKGILSQTEEWLETIEPRDVKKPVSKQPGPEDVPQKVTTKPAPPPAAKQSEQTKPIIKDKWTLRVVTYKNTKENVEKAKTMAKTIQDIVGLDTFIVNNGKEIFICAGEFEEADSAELITAQRTLSDFKYQNKKQFEGSYPIRMK